MSIKGIRLAVSTKGIMLADIEIDPAIGLSILDKIGDGLCGHGYSGLTEEYNGLELSDF